MRERVGQVVPGRVGDGTTDRGVGQGRPGGERAGELGGRAASSSSSTTRVASPSASASSARTVRGSSSSSLALAAPTSRGSHQDDPVSQDSATPAKARLKPAVRPQPEVAGEGDRGPGAGRDPVDGRDDRLGHRRQQGRDRVEVLGDGRHSDRPGSRAGDVVLRSCPAQKPARRRSARHSARGVVGDLAAGPRAAAPWSAMSRELSASGRLRVTVATAPLSPAAPRRLLAVRFAVVDARLGPGRPRRWPPRQRRRSVRSRQQLAGRVWSNSLAARRPGQPGGSTAPADPGPGTGTCATRGPAGCGRRSRARGSGRPPGRR